MDVILEWNTICRICLQEGELHSIFDEDDEDHCYISDKITKCSDLKIYDNQNMPEQICNNCLADLNTAFRFRNNCEKSNAILEGLIKAEMERETVVYSVKGKTYTYEPPCGLNIKRIPTAAPLSTVSNKPLSKSPPPSPIMEILEDTYDSQSVEVLDMETVIKSETYEVILEEEPIEEEFIEESDEIPEYEMSAIQSSTTTVSKSKSSKKASTNAGGVGKKGRQKGEKPLLVCELCGNHFKYRHVLEAHMRRHRKEKPFPCEICGKAFVLNVELSCHMRTHTGQKPYACRFCDRRFSDFGSRIKHERSHTGERPYACETCGKAFAYSYGLSSHILTHTGEKPHSCEKCGKRFTKKHHLKTHMKTHMKQEMLLTQVGQPVEKRNEHDEMSQNSDENILVVLASQSQMENMEPYVEEMAIIEEDEENVVYEQKPTIIFEEES